MPKYINITASIQVLDDYPADQAAVELTTPIREAITGHPAPCGVRIHFVVANHPLEMPWVEEEN